MACRLNPSHLLLLAKLEAKKGNFQSISQNILLPKKSYVCHAKAHKKTSSKRRCSTAAIMDRRKETETSELVQSDDIDIHYESRFDDSLDYKPRDVYNYFRRLQEEEKEKHCLHLQPNHLRPYGSTNGLYFPYVLQPLQSSSIVPQDRHASTLVFEKPKHTREFSSYRCEEITPENESMPYYHEDVLDERASRSTIKSSTSRQSCSRFKKSSLSRTKFMSNEIHTRSISGLARTRNYSKVSIRKEIKAKKTLPKLYFDSTPKPLKEEMKDFLISPLKKKYETYYVPRKCEEFETVTKRADDDWKFIAKAFHKISDTPKPQYSDELKDCAPIKRLQKIKREEPKRVCEEPPNYCQKRSDDGMVFAKKKLKPLLASNIPEPIKAKNIETNKIKRLPKKNLMEPQKIRPITPKCSDNLRADKNLTISKYSLPKLDFTSTLPPPQRTKPDLTPLRRLPKVLIEPRKCKPPEPIQKCQRADDHWKMTQKRLPSIKGSEISPAKSEPLKVSAPLKRLIPKVFNYEAPKCKVEPVKECYRSDIDDWEFPSEIPEEFPKALVQKKSTSLTNLKRSMSTNISNHDYGNLLFRVSQTSFMDIRKRFSKSFSETIIPKVGIHLSVYRSCADEDDSRKRNVQPKYSKTHPFQPIEPVKPRTEIIDPIKEDECLRKQSGGSIRDKITGTCSNPKPKRTLLSFWKKGSTDDTSKSDPHCSKKMSNCSKSQSCPEIFKPAEKSSSSTSLLAGCPEIFSPNCPPKPPGPPPCPPSSPSKPICPPKKPSKPICPPTPCPCPPPCPPPKSPPCPPPKPPPCPPPKSPPCPPPKSPPCPPKPKCPPPTPPKPKCPPPPPCPCPPPSPPCPCPPPCPPTSSKCQPTQLSAEPCAPSVSHERPPSFWQRFKNMFKSNPNCITPAQYRRNKKLKKMQKIASKSGFAVYDPCEDPEKICKEIEKTCEHVNKKGFCKTKKRCFSTYAALHSFSTASQGSNGIFNDLIISKNMVLPNYYLQKLFSSWRKPTHHSGEKMIEDTDGNVDLDSLSETMLRTLSVEKLQRTSVIDKSTALEHNLKNLEIKNMNLMERIQKALQNLENKQTSKDADSTKRSEDILKTKSTK